MRFEFVQVLPIRFGHEGSRAEMSFVRYQQSSKLVRRKIEFLAKMSMVMSVLSSQQNQIGDRTDIYTNGHSIAKKERTGRYRPG